MPEPNPNYAQIIVWRVFLVQTVLLAILAAIFIYCHFANNALFSFPIAFIVGCLGASIRLIQRLSSQKPEVQKHLTSNWSSTLMPFMYGGMMAAVAYLLFMAKILTGDAGGGLLTTNVFPTFNEPQAANDTLSLNTILAIRPSSVKDFAKLLVWCFLAGYSEMFIERILNFLEKGFPVRRA
jgi:hypothetical protein